MKIKTIIAAVALLCACAAQAAETLLDVDFTKAPKSVNSSSLGSCTGVLPEGVGDNFSSWSEGRCTTSLQEEDGVKFLRFTSDTGKGIVQFAVYCPKVKLPGFFRLTVKGRVRGNPLGLGLRLNPAPYTSFSQHQFGTPDWSEQSYLFTVSQKAEKNVGLYLYPSRGETDLQRIVLEKVDRADIVRSIPRSPATQREFVSRRFLLGLPNGWNDGRDTFTGTVTAVSDPDASTPVLRLASESDKQLTVGGEPFQTSDPYAPHVVSVRCRGAGTWNVQVATDKNFKSVVKTVKVKGWKKTSKRIKGLKKKTVYYVRVRTYMKASGGTFYSKWSKVKKIKTK